MCNGIVTQSVENYLGHWLWWSQATLSPFQTTTKILAEPLLEGLLLSHFLLTHILILEVVLTMGFDTVTGFSLTFIFHILGLAVAGPLTSQTMFNPNNIIA